MIICTTSVITVPFSVKTYTLVIGIFPVIKSRGYIYTVKKDARTKIAPIGWHSNLKQTVLYFSILIRGS